MAWGWIGKACLALPPVERQAKLAEAVEAALRAAGADVIIEDVSQLMPLCTYSCARIAGLFGFGAGHALDPYSGCGPGLRAPAPSMAVRWCSAPISPCMAFAGRLRWASYADAAPVLVQLDRFGDRPGVRLCAVASGGSSWCPSCHQRRAAAILGAYCRRGGLPDPVRADPGDSLGRDARMAAGLAHNSDRIEYFIRKCPCSGLHLVFLLSFP